MKTSNIYSVKLKGIYHFLSVDGTAKFDCVFWFGDLNFRIDQGRHTVEDLVKAIVEQEHPNFEDLLRGDELNDCILKGMMHLYLAFCYLAVCVFLPYLKYREVLPEQFQA